MKFYNLFFFIVTFSVFVSCKVNHSHRDKSKLQITEAYLQDEVPGESGGTINTYLNIKLQYDASVQPNHIIFRNLQYTIEKNPTDIKLNIANGQPQEKQYSLNPHQAIIFYNYKGKMLNKILDNIGTKETIYLP